MHDQTEQDSWKIQEDFLGDLNVGAALLVVGGVLVVAALIMPASFGAGLFALFFVTGLALLLMGQGLRSIGVRKREAFEVQRLELEAQRAIDHRFNSDRRKGGERRKINVLALLIGERLAERRSGYERRHPRERRADAA